MRLTLSATIISALLGAAALSGPAEAAGHHAHQVCFSQAQVRQMMARKEVVPPLAAIRAAHAAAGGKTIRADLCRRDDDLVYHITTLARNGRVVRVVVDARSGKVTSKR